MQDYSNVVKLLSKYETLFPPLVSYTIMITPMLTHLQGNNGIFGQGDSISPHLPSTHQQFPNLRVFLEYPLPPGYHVIMDKRHSSLQPSRYLEWLQTQPFLSPESKVQLGGEYGISLAV